VAAGYRSLAAPWLGGAAAPSRPAAYRSLLAPWLGGAFGYAGTTPPEPPLVIGGGWKPRRIPIDRDRFTPLQLARDEDDVILATIMAAIHAGILKAKP
jgi:hypothetical protein